MIRYVHFQKFAIQRFRLNILSNNFADLDSPLLRLLRLGGVHGIKGNIFDNSGEVLIKKGTPVGNIGLR